MKKNIKRLLITVTIGSVIMIALLVVLDQYIMPIYVDAEQVELPNFIDMHKDEAIKIIESMNLNPVLSEPRYDPKVKIDHVLFQKPSAGKLVKENRRVYLHISGGEALVKMPNLRQKTYRDARITLERIGLHIRNIKQVKSEFPSDIIVDQEFEEGTFLAKGDSVNLKISIGPRIGMIAVPNLIARSRTEADKILRRNNLKLGNITYIESSLLTNTIIDQYPGEGSLLRVGESVDIWVAKSR